MLDKTDLKQACQKIGRKIFSRCALKEIFQVDLAERSVFALPALIRNWHGKAPPTFMQATGSRAKFLG